MLVSVIVPIYNAQQYLSACIESILGQSYTDFELILVNDGSTDGSLSVCEQYRAKDTRVIVLNKVNGGSASAKNEGLKIAKGEFVEFVDADDTIDKTYLENMMSGVDDTVDLCVGNMCFVVQRNGETVSQKHFNLESGSFSLKEFLSFYPRYMPQAIFGSPCNKLYRYSLIADNELHFDVTLKNNEDTRFNYAYIAKCNRVFVSNEPFYRYVDHGCASMSKRYIENLFDIYVGTYHCAKAFLKETDMYDELISFQDKYFIGLVIGAISNIVKKDKISSKKQKIKNIKSILTSDEVITALSNARMESSTKKAIVLLMRLRFANLLYLLFQIK